MPKQGVHRQEGAEFRRQGFREQARSPSIAEIEKEIEEALVLVVRNEDRLRRIEFDAKPTRTPTKVLERVEASNSTAGISAGIQHGRPGDQTADT